MTEAPLVSVIIPCFRQAQYLREAIDSALAQTYPAIEILVVNDGSDDDTEAVAKSYGDRIRYIYRDNGGLSAARNTAIAQARGMYLKFLDADDVLHPEQIAWQAAALAGRTDCLAMTAVRLFRDGVPEQFQDHIPRQAHDLIAFLLSEYDAWIPPIGFLVPTALVRSVGGFNESLRYFEDWDIFSRIGLEAPQLVTDSRVGAYYRLRPGSMSANRIGMMVTRTRLLNGLHDMVRDRGRADWFGVDLLRAEQGCYQALVMLGAGDAELREQLLRRIRELQGVYGFGQFGWRFRLLSFLVGYAQAERIRAGLVKWLGRKPPESLDTGAWRDS